MQKKGRTLKRVCVSARLRLRIRCLQWQRRFNAFLPSLRRTVLLPGWGARSALSLTQLLVGSCCELHQEMHPKAHPEKTCSFLNTETVHNMELVPLLEPAHSQMVACERRYVKRCVHLRVCTCVLLFVCVCETNIFQFLCTYTLLQTILLKARPVLCALRSSFLTP